MSKKKLALISSVVVLCLGVAIALIVVRVFFVRLIRVPTGSMMNTIIPGDHLVVSRIVGEVKRGDIVIFRYPDAPEFFVARVIGLPGETIQLQGRSVLIDGRALDEQRVIVAAMEDSYDPLTELSTEGTGPYRVYYRQRQFEEVMPEESGEFGTTEPFLIPAASCFLLGDNRDNSYDSRYRGVVPQNLIWGKPTVIYYSAILPDEDKVRTERFFKRVE